MKHGRFKKIECNCNLITIDTDVKYSNKQSAFNLMPGVSEMNEVPYGQKCHFINIGLTED